MLLDQEFTSERWFLPFYVILITDLGSGGYFPHKFLSYH